MSKIKTTPIKFNIIHCLTWIGITQLTGLIGGFFTAASITEWYRYLNKPSFNPPNSVFGPVWTILYALMGISVYRIWRLSKRRPEVQFLVILFCVHLIANLFWSIAFFGWRSPELGFYAILVLLGFIITMIYKFWRFDRISSLLLFPYLFWVIFATALNYSIWQLNP